VSVVATTTVFADMVARIGGDRVTVTSLVPKGGEVHTFDPTPSLARRVAEANLLVMNGLGLDDWLRQLAVDAGTHASVLVLSDGVPSTSVILSDEGTPNPHVWLDVKNAETYVTEIARGLAAADPAGSDVYAANEAAYLRVLDALDATARSTMAAIPAEQRRVVAFHDALPYFARAYGLEIVGVVLPAPGQDPSASYIARLVDTIRTEHARAIVAEVQFSPALAQTLSRETGVDVVTDVYDDTLGDPPVDSYEGLIRWDVERIAEALR
jgi:ABC-type Zn uptake system ZnuABC Zn-binding protein ZnuA